MSTPLLPATDADEVHVDTRRVSFTPRTLPDTVLRFEDLRYFVKPHAFARARHVLRGVSATVPASMFAVLGPSGAGKTTMLDILAGRKSNVGGRFSGRVMLNGVPLAPEELRACIGYVMSW